MFAESLQEEAEGVFEAEQGELDVGDLVGRWRIEEMERWNRDYLDMEQPAEIGFTNKGRRGPWRTTGPSGRVPRRTARGCPAAPWPPTAAVAPPSVTVGASCAARQAIVEYIEVFYNRKRKHSTLGYLSPAAFESEHEQEVALAA